MLKLAGSKAVFNVEYKEEDADPNIIGIELKKLNDKVSFCPTKPFECKGCQSCLSNEIIEEGKWKCKFCGEENEIGTRVFERSERDEIDYLIKERDINTSLNRTIVFCVDISGSMRGKSIESIKKGIIEQIQFIKQTQPKQKVCVVQFESEVDILGDCCHNTIHIKSNLLNEFDGLVDVAKEKVELNEVEVSCNNLIQTVSRMTTKDCTALGPAVLVSTVIAGKESNGQVILCTDGMANKGLNGIEFYNKVAEIALRSGVVININTIDGCQANVKEIGEMASKTSGEVVVLKADQMKELFSDLLTKTLIATNVSLSIHLPNEIFIKDIKGHKEPSNTKIYYGNVVDDSMHHFSYGLKVGKKVENKFGVQVCIDYKMMDGTVVKRVCNKTIELAKVNEEIERDGEILQTYYMKKAAEKQKEGDIEETKRNIGRFRNAQSISCQPCQVMFTEYVNEYERNLYGNMSNDYSASMNYQMQNFTTKKAFQHQQYGRSGGNGVPPSRTKFTIVPTNISPIRTQLPQFNALRPILNQKIVLAQPGQSEMKQIEEWTIMKIGNIIFDSDFDNWEKGTSVFGQRVMNKSNLVFLIEDTDGNKFGGYVNSRINKIDCWIYDANAFIFSLKPNENKKFDIQYPLHAFWLCNPVSSNLFTVGHGYDICVGKESNKNNSYCYQSTFDYNGIQNALCGKTQPTPFTTKKITVIQLNPVL